VGKIHDALRRAEEERVKLGAVLRDSDDAEVEAQLGEDLVDELPGPLIEAPSRWSRLLRFPRALRGSTRPASGSGPTRPLVDGLDTNAIEEYRSMRQRIQSLRRTRDVKSIVITSALPGEGKTTTATNLALSFGLQREVSTCLVDADLRAPAVHQALPHAPMAGLAELLDADAKLQDVLIEVEGTRLSILPVCALPTNPSELLASPRMLELLTELHSRFDTVLLDAPPITGLPDATALVDLCDAALLVVSASSTSRRDIAAAIEHIDAAKLMGTIFNRCEGRTTQDGAGYGFRPR
jgi:capsular exopolysaccharide synthesis family protein